MSVESGENSQPSAFSSSSHRAPPPPFSSSTFASNQRKRPVLSGLGSESTTQSDFTSPNTPTPYEAKIDISSLHQKTTPPEPMTSSFAAGTPIYHHIPHASQSQPSTKEPHLSSIHALLNEFQLHYDIKKQRISALESQIHAVEGRLQQREIELQNAATERITAFKQLEAQKNILDEMQKKLNDFSKYEPLIASRFASFENLMTEMSNTKAKYLEKEVALNKSLEEKSVHLEDSLRSIGELRLQKSQLESTNLELDEEIKQQRSQFNQKMHELSSEIKEITSKMDALYQEKEILKADLKNMAFERDRYQRESAQALKEISSLAISDAFASGCSEDNLRSLASAVSWIKKLCTELHQQHSNSETISESLKAELTAQLRERHSEIATLKAEISNSTSKCGSLQTEIERLEKLVPDVDYLEIIHDLGFSGPDWQTELQSFIEASRSLEEKYNELQQEHAKEIAAIKDHYSKILRDETSALKVKLDKSEAELAKVKSNSQPKPSSFKENPDLTTILGLKAFGKTLSEKDEARSNPKKRTKITSSSSVASTSNQKGSSRSLRSSTTKLSSPTKSQDSVLSSDIWTIFN